MVAKVHLQEWTWIGSGFRAWLQPLVHLANNPLSLLGVVVVTTATIFIIFLAPTIWGGTVENPYMGIVAFLMVPAIFIVGLLLIPLGIYLRRRRARREGTDLASFPPLDLRNADFRRLLIFVGATTIVNMVIVGQFAYGSVNYMDSVEFCGRDLPHGDAAGVLGLSELAALACGMREVPYRSGRRLVREKQTIRSRPGVRGYFQHLPETDTDAGPESASRARDLRDLPLAPEVRRRPAAGAQQVR